MALPYRINDRRSSTGFVNNRLIEAATQTQDRKTVGMLDQDVHKSVTSYGRRVLMTLGRHMFWRYPALQASILEQANLAVGSFIPQFTGKDKAWGELAEDALREWHKIMDVAGHPYDFDSFLQGKVVSPIVDGEDFTLLTENQEGYPLVQVIPAHRVGSKTQANGQVAVVKYTGSQMFIDGILVDANRPYQIETELTFETPVVDGVVVDYYGRALAYRVYNGGEFSAEYQDISARNLFPSFCPMIAGQVRGFSLLASSVFDWQDMHEWGRFEMLAQKIFSSQTLVETNESGEADSAKDIISASATRDSSGNKTALDVQQLDGGTIRYLKAGSGSTVEAFKYDRPGASSQAFIKNKLRDAFRGTEWDVFFSLDPQAVGGAPMRVIVEKINAVLEKRRKLVRKACSRVDGYAISRFIKLGILPPNDEWYKWEYQGPGDVTADKKYDSDVALQEISQGIGTRKKAIAARGEYIEEVDEQREREADSDLERAGRLAKKHGITIQEAIVILRPPSPGAQMPQSTSSQQPAATDSTPAAE